MTKDAARLRRDIASRRVAGFLADREIATVERCADNVVDMVLDVLREPDREMLEAGRAEIVSALPTGRITTTHQRQLVLAVWRAMLDRADR